MAPSRIDCSQPWRQGVDDFRAHPDVKVLGALVNTWYSPGGTQNVPTSSGPPYLQFPTVVFLRARYTALQPHNHAVRPFPLIVDHS